MSETFYWHDYETFGANPSMDRPVQFAGIRTDEDLNPVGEPDAGDLAERGVRLLRCLGEHTDADPAPLR